MYFLLDGVHLHSGRSQPVKDGLVSEPDIELFKVNIDSSLPGDPVSHLRNNFFVGHVQRDRGDVVLGSLPDLLVVDSSGSL